MSTTPWGCAHKPLGGFQPPRVPHGLAPLTRAPSRATTLGRPSTGTRPTPTSCSTFASQAAVALEQVVEDPQREPSAFQKMRMERRKSIRREQFVYMVAAISATSLMAFLAVFATYYRFVFLMGGVHNFPWLEFCATLVLVFCGMAAMEMYARVAHKFLWHDFKPGWALHESHHEPRKGPLEANDLYAVANAIPAISLCAYGFFNTGLAGGLCFGCGLGITLFGIMYMFVHDGLVHKRFPVGPIAKVPYLKRIAAAHSLHHSDKYDGFPWGMFLGLEELKKYPEALKEVDAIVAASSREERRLLKKRLRKLGLERNTDEGNGSSIAPVGVPVPA